MLKKLKEKKTRAGKWWARRRVVQTQLGKLGRATPWRASQTRVRSSDFVLSVMKDTGVSATVMENGL